MYDPPTSVWLCDFHKDPRNIADVVYARVLPTLEGRQTERFQQGWNVRPGQYRWWLAALRSCDTVCDCGTGCTACSNDRRLPADRACRGFLLRSPRKVGCDAVAQVNIRAAEPWRSLNARDVALLCDKILKIPGPICHP